MEKIIKPVHVKPAMYALFYENLKRIAKVCGYNLVLHGSMNRDMDLIAIPWSDKTSEEIFLIQRFEKYLTGKITKGDDYMFKVLPGGRNSYVINLNRGGKQGEWKGYDSEYYLDISITPKI